MSEKLSHVHVAVFGDTAMETHAGIVSDELVRRTSGVEMGFHLHDSTNKTTPHITLASIPYPTDAPHYEAPIVEACVVACKAVVEQWQADNRGLTFQFLDVGAGFGWLWLVTSMEPLTELHEMVVAQDLGRESVTPRPLLPHVTVGRLRAEHKATRKEVNAALASMREAAGCFIGPAVTYTMTGIAVGRSGPHGSFTHLHELIKF